MSALMDQLERAVRSYAAREPSGWLLLTDAYATLRRVLSEQATEIARLTERVAELEREAQADATGWEAWVQEHC